MILLKHHQFIKTAPNYYLETKLIIIAEVSSNDIKMAVSPQLPLFFYYF